MIYPFDERREVLPFVPVSARVVLDVGCGRGGFGFALRREGPARTLWAVEPDPDLAAEAAHHYDGMLTGTYPEALDSDGSGRPAGPDGPGVRFDCIVFNDVLEHLVDPWAVLRDTVRHLAPGGTVVASIPNVRNARTVARLVVRGDWTYVDMGVLDRTHLRFFTRRTVRALFEDSGYEVEALAGINVLGRSRSRAARALPALVGEFAYMGFAIRAHPIRYGPA